MWNCRSKRHITQRPCWIYIFYFNFTIKCSHKCFMWEEPSLYCNYRWMMRRIFQIFILFLENEKFSENWVLTARFWEIEKWNFEGFLVGWWVSKCLIHLHNSPKFTLPIPYFHSENLATFSVSMYSYTSKLKKWLKFHLLITHLNEFFNYLDRCMFIEMITVG